MENERLAKVFDAMAREKKYDRYRKIAYENAAAAIRRYPKIITSGKQARKEVKGIGESIASKIDEVLRTGTLAILEDRTVDEVQKEAILQLFEKIHGVGIKTAEKWYQKGYRTIEDLKKEYVHMTDAQKISYYFFDDLQQKISREEIDTVKEYLTIIWSSLKIEFLITGSYRRGESESNDIDVVVKDGITMEELLAPLLNDGFILGNLAIGVKTYMGIVSLRIPLKNDKYIARRLDIRLVEKSEWPFTLLSFTGNTRFNIELRRRATSLGFTLNEYSLTDNQGNTYPAQSEKDIFDFLQTNYLPPEQRKGNFVLSFDTKKLLEDKSIQKVEEKLVQDKSQKEEELVQKVEDKSQKVEESYWYRPTEDLFIYIDKDVVNTGKVAAFDLDGTLIRPKKGEFPKDVNDVFLLPNRIETLQKYHKDGYMIAIFTNQKSRNDNEKLFKYTRIVNTLRLISDASITPLPLVLFMSTGDDEYRKPNTGMWKALQEMGKIDQAFYTGNSVGRKYDHSDVDIMFAKNIGISFFTPEKIFGI